MLFTLHQILSRDPVGLRLGLVGLDVLALVAVLSRLVALNRRQQLLLSDPNAWVLDIELESLSFTAMPIYKINSTPYL